MGRVGRRQFLSATVAFFAAPLTSHAQKTTRQYRVGFLTTAGLTTGSHLHAAFRQGLRELGWVEGQSIVIDHRRAEGKFERLPGLAADLARLKVDVIVVTTTQAALAAKNATRTIPIITVTVGDPIATGLVTSLARPEGNITGLTMSTGPEMGGKLLQLLKETVPQASRIAALWNSANPGHASWLREAENGARKLEVQLQLVAAGGLDSLEGAFAAIARERPHALLTLPDPLFFFQRRRLLDFAAKNSLPAMYSWKEAVEDGGLMAYGPDQADLFHRAAIYVDKILKGAKPADLPMQLPTKFESVINLKTARALGLTIPPSVLLRASQVIE